MSNRPSLPALLALATVGAGALPRLPRRLASPRAARRRLRSRARAEREGSGDSTWHTSCGRDGLFRESVALPNSFAQPTVGGATGPGYDAAMQDGFESARRIPSAPPNR